GLTEGQGTGTFTVASFLDAANEPAGTFTVVVSWGDGQTSYGSVTEVGSSDVYEVTASYAYAETGTYSIAVTVGDASGASVAPTSDAFFVAGAPLEDLTILDPGATEGVATGTIVIATFIDDNPIPDSDYVATVYWGDGSAADYLSSANNDIVFDAANGVWD